MIDRDHLKGIVALWLTSGEPVDANNDTRYWAFSGGWSDAAFATDRLVDAGLIEYVDDAGTDGYRDNYLVVPTKLGVYEAIR